MRDTSASGSAASAPLFWRVFLLNGLVFLAGVGGLTLSPATVSFPPRLAELVVLGGGLVVMLAMNGVLLRLGLSPLDRLRAVMGTVDLLHPGQRLAEKGSGELTPLVRSFNDMLERLERERAVSSARVLSAQESERARVARELHDEIGQSLTVVLLEVSRLSDLAPESLQPALGRVRERARASLEDLRRIASGLRPEALEELGLTAALSALIDEFTTFSGIPVRRRLVHSVALSQDVELVIYRLAQESLTNIARHADASMVEFVLEDRDRGGVRMTIGDDGHGFVGHEGGGIRGMRERALLVKADLHITSADGHGTRLTLQIPPQPLPPGAD